MSTASNDLSAPGSEEQIVILPFEPADSASGRVPTSKIIKTWLDRSIPDTAFTVAVVSTLFLGLVYLLSRVEALGLHESWIASKDQVFTQGQWWRAFTATLLHADAGHLLSNSLLFAVFAFFLSGYFGLALFPALAFVFGGLTNLVVLWNYPAEMRLLGASGVVYWMGGVWLALYVGLDRRRSFTQRLMRAVGVGFLLFLPSEAFDPKVSYMAHAVGFGLGVVVGAVYFFWRKAEFRAAEVVETLPEEPELMVAVTPSGDWRFVTVYRSMLLAPAVAAAVAYPVRSTSASNSASASTSTVTSKSSDAPAQTQSQNET